MSIIPGLPDEVALWILARLPYLQRFRLRCVCRAWKLAFDSATILAERKALDLCEAWPLFLSLDTFDSLFILVDPFCVRRSYRVPRPPQLCGDCPRPLALGVVGIMNTQILIAAMPSNILSAIPLSTLEQEESLKLQGLYSFDVASMKWANSRYSPLPTTLFPMKVEQPYKQVVAADTDGGYLYVAEAFGSYHGLLKGVERLSLKTRTWETLPRPVVKREGAAGVVLQGFFCLIGGSLHQQSLIHNSGEIWDPASGKWSVVPALWPSEVFGKCFVPSKVAVMMDRLYALRRESILEELMYYKSSSMTWISLGYVPMVLPSSDKVRLLGLGKELWVVGDDGLSCLVTEPVDSRPLSWRFAPNFSRGRLYKHMIGIAIL